MREGTIVRLGRGVFVLAEEWPQEPGYEGDVARHLVRCRAAGRRYPDAHLCGVSRLVAAGIRVWGVPLLRVELARDVRQEVLTQSYRIRPLDAVTRPTGDGEGAIAAALVQLALDHGVTPAVCSADHALHEWRTTFTRLEQTARSIKGRARSSRLASVLALVDARAESVGESRLRVDLTLQGHKVLVQVPILEGSHIFARADLGIDGTNYLVEFDGQVKYAGDDGPAAVWAEKKREDRIRRKGHAMDRFVWSDLDRPRVIAARIEDGLKGAETRPSTFEDNHRGRTLSPRRRPDLGRGSTTA